MRQLTRLIALLLLLGPLRLSAQSNKLVTLSMKDQPLKEVIRSIVQQTGYNVVVTEKILAEARKVTVEVKDVPLEKALQEIFRKTDLNCSLVEGSIIITKKSDAINSGGKQLPESIKVGGRITNSTGSSLAGATITAKGKNGYTFSFQTDENGRFGFVVDASSQITVSFVNYQSKSFRVKESNSDLNIILEKDDKQMETVVISTGYQKIERKHITGSVTTLKMDSIMQPGLTTIDKMLEGRVPGMTYMQNSGQAGSVPKLRVRGTSTLLGSQEPLWVVDGIVQADPVNIPANRINDLDFVNLVGNAISGLNPNDIDQIDVLKDAAATALYGVRAANGVIVVTTKRGKPGPPAVTYTGTVGWQRRPTYSDNSVYMMNSKERVDASREIIQRQLPFSGIPVGYEKAIIDYYNGQIDYDTYIRKVNQAETINTDWLSIVMRDAVQASHTLQVSGGNQTGRYFASVGYMNEPGVIKNEMFKRYTGTIGFDLSYKKFTSRFTLNANKTDRKYTPPDVNILGYAYGTSRAIPLYNEDGSLYFYPTTSASDYREYSRPTMNIVNEMNHSGQTQDGTEYRATADIKYDIFPGLSVSSALAYSVANVDQSTWFQENTNHMDRIRGADYGKPDRDPAPFGGQLFERNNTRKSYTVRGEVNYNRFVDESRKHMLNVTFGSELQSTTYYSIEQVRRGYYPERGSSFAMISARDYPGYASWVTMNGVARIEDSRTNIASLYSSATYIYDDRLVLTLAGRSDYSNAFGTRSNEKFLPNWNLSGRWNMHHDVMKNVRWIDILALKLAYGTQGNMLPNQTPYAIIGKDYYTSDYNRFTSIIKFFPNPNLKWEKTNSYDVGLDFSFLKGKISGSLNLFYKRTSNVFLAKKVSELNGIGQYVVNAGTVENKGVEITMNFTPVENLGAVKGKRGFTWRIDPQMGQVLNQLINTAINNRASILYDPNSITYDEFLRGNVPVDGKSLNTFYSYRYKELNNAGTPMFYGAELSKAAELTEKYKKMDRVSVFREVMVESGRRVPVIQGGIGNYFSYRNWMFSFNFTYSIGNKIRMLRIASGGYSTFRPNSQQNLRKEFVDRWRYPGDEAYTNIPGLSVNASNPLVDNNTGATYGGPVFATSYYQMYDDSDLRVVDGSFVKLQSVSLKYLFSPEFCSRIFVKTAWMGLSGSNLVTIANKALKGQDPSQSGSVPSLSMSVRPVYSFNVSVTF